MKKTLQIVTCIAASATLAACGASANGGKAPNNVASVSSNVLQFAAGTANYAGVTSLNVVATYRQPAGAYAPGDSGTLLNSPTITLPAAITGLVAGTGASYDPLSTVLTGPATSEIGNDTITSSSQNAQTTAVTSFGQSGGVFSLGIEPFNAQGSGTVANNGGNPSSDGTPFQVAPYLVPLYDSASGTDPNEFVPWGGPPAFIATGSGGDSIVGDGNYPAGDAGLSEGIDVFDGIAPVAGGTYTLSVNVPANTGATTQTASFTMPAALTTIPTPVNPAFVPDGKGGGTFNFVMPAGATEAFVQVTDFGAVGAAPAPAPVYYTLETTSTGTLTLPDAIGPSGAPSTATGDQIVVQVVAFDYPAYEINPLNSPKSPSPTILGGNKSDDLAVSAATCAVSGGGACSALPLLRHREFTAAYANRARIR